MSREKSINAAINRLEAARLEHGEDCLLCAVKDARIDEAIKLLKSKLQNKSPIEFKFDEHSLESAENIPHDEIKAGDKTIILPKNETEPEPTELNLSDEFVMALVNDVKQSSRLKTMPNKFIIELLTNRVWGEIKLMTFESNLLDEAIDRLQELDRLTAEKRLDTLKLKHANSLNRVLVNNAQKELNIREQLQDEIKAKEIDLECLNAERDSYLEELFKLQDEIKAKDELKKQKIELLMDLIKVLLNTI